jgi:hypothetical protein
VRPAGIQATQLWPNIDGSAVPTSFDYRYPFEGPHAVYLSALSIPSSVYPHGKLLRSLLKLFDQRSRPWVRGATANAKGERAKAGVLGTLFPRFNSPGTPIVSDMA